jgi:hypothetical protein
MAWRIGEARGFTDTRSFGRRCRNNNDLMSGTIEALDA